MTRCTYCTSIPLANRSVEMSTLDEPVLNSFMTRSLSSVSMAEWMAEIVKFYSLMALDRLSTEVLVLQ